MDFLFSVRVNYRICHVKKYKIQVDKNSQTHFLQEKHDWGKVVKNSKDWNQVQPVVKKVMGSKQGNIVWKNKDAFMNNKKVDW